MKADADDEAARLYERRRAGTGTFADTCRLCELAMPSVALYLKKWVPPKHLEDAVQQTMLQFWRRDLERYDGSIPFRMYAIVCARSSALSFLRTVGRSRRREFKHSVLQPFSESDEGRSASGIEGALNFEDVVAAARLTSVEYTIAFLRYVEEYSAKKIGVALNENERFVLNKLATIRNKLRRGIGRPRRGLNED